MATLKEFPKFSIVTPSLNQGRFLQQCIESVRSQGWPEVEHFVIDGGSTDDTLQVIQNNRDFLTSYISEPDKGAADAINKGFDLCTGDILAWLNADDFYLPGAFAKVAEAWRKNPNSGFWFGNGIRVTESGKVKSKFNPGPVSYNHQALIEGLDYILQPSTFINPSVLVKVGFLNTDLRWSFDWDLWIRLAKLERPSCIDAELAATREWGSTLTANGGFRRIEELRLMAERHSGKPITHGVLCYWLDTLTEFIRNNPNEFQSGVPEALKNVWAKLIIDMDRLSLNEPPVRSTTGSVANLVKSQPSSLINSWPSLDKGNELIVAIDLYPLTQGASGGIVPWVQGVLREMINLYSTDRILVFHRPGKPPINLQGANIKCIELSEHPATFYKEMTRYCEAASVNVVIRTYPQEHHPELPFQRQVFVIPDIQHEFFPEFFSRHVLAARRRAFAFALTRAGAIATMTEHSRSTVISNEWTLCKDVFLMPAALPEELRTEPDDGALPEQARAFSQFFFMPANLWPHKNHKRLFEAFRIALPNLPPNTGLILTGSPEGWSSVIEGYEKLPIVHLGFVEHEQVAALYRNAVALVYFSLFEGFGMPLLEAFYHGTPVLCSNLSSLPEVGGDAVLTCDPTNVEEMAGLMRQILNDGALRKKLAEKTHARLSAYDWASPAKELHAALVRVASAEKVVEPSTPLISIVMPTRNHAQFIRAAIDSVLKQDYPRVELIVVDGASSDNTMDILKSYGTRIRWISEPDNGQTDAINKGMALASGEILAYLNSDDVLLDGALKKVVEFFTEYPECDLVYGNADYIDVEGNVIGTYSTAEFSFERLMQDCCICQPAAFWRRRIVNRVGPFNEQLQTAMDYEYWLRIANSGGILYHTHEKLAQSRLHEDAKTLSMRGKIFQEIFQICEEQGGYVSHSYCSGLWAYRLYETTKVGPYLKRILPSIHRIPALLHYSVLMSKLYNKREAFLFLSRSVFNSIDHRSPLLGAVIRKMWRNASALRRT